MLEEYVLNGCCAVRGHPCRLDATNSGHLFDKFSVSSVTK